MNKKLAKMREERAAGLGDMQSILALTEKEDRKPTDEEQAKFEALDEQTDILAKKIEQAEKLQRKQLEAKVVHVALDNEELGDTIESTIPSFEKDPKVGFANLGAFALAVRTRMSPGMPADMADTQRLNYLAAATGMNAAIGSQGGFLLPQEFNLAIWDGMKKDPDNLLALTDNYTVEGDSLTFNANAETSRATGSRYGAIRAYWLHEAAQKTSSTVKFRQIKIEPKELAILIYVTDKLLRGAGIALSQYLTKAATEEIGFMVSDAIINGTGAGQPQGILNSAAVVSQAKQGTQAVGSATVVTENIVKMWSRCDARARRNAVWFINQDVEPQLMTMTLNVGTGGAPTYLPPGGLNASPYAILLGRPVIPIEYCATVGTVGDIILANLKYYCSGTKGGVMSDMSIHLRFDYNETCFRFLFEVDGQPWMAAPITPFKGAANTRSAFVTLATR